MAAPEPFADVAYLQQAWRTLTPSEQSRATYLLGKASRQIRRRAPGIDDRIGPEGDLDGDLVRDIVCDMVRRTMEAEDTAPGTPPVETYQTSVGPFQDSYKFANPTGDMYLTKSEKRDLGIGAQRAFSVSLIGDGS